MNLKQKYWENALFQYDGKSKRICFHSREIRTRRGAFNPELIDYESFISDLSEMINAIPFTLYASHIDKIKHVNKYYYPATPYDLCMTFVIERIMLDLPANSKCIIVLEARGKKEDQKLLKYIISLIDHGTQYCSYELFKKIKGVYFNPKWCKEENEQKSYWELELADLCAYPIQKYFIYRTKDKAFELLKHKINCYPDYIGKGLKSFP